MHLTIPDGYFVEDHLVFGEPGEWAIVGRMYDFGVPDLSSSDDVAWEDLEMDLRLVLGSLMDGERLQAQWYTGNDFEKELGEYEQKTRQVHKEAEEDIQEVEGPEAGQGDFETVSQRVRQELVGRYRGRIKERTLVNSSLKVCLSSQLPRFITASGRKARGFEEVFKVMKRSFASRATFWDNLMRASGGSVRGLTDLEHRGELQCYWSPGAAALGDSGAQIDWLRTMGQLCRSSALADLAGPDHGFYLDGYYFGLLVAKTFPRSTWPKTLAPFMGLAISGVRIVLNMEPLRVEGEMRHEEERYSKLVSNLEDKATSLASEVGLDKHRDRMKRLISNQVLPFKAQFLVIVQDKTLEGMRSKLEAARVALGKSGCESYEPALATSAVAYFNCGTPGYGPWVKYRDYRHRIDDGNLANMWPVGSSPKGELDGADWICDGDQNNLIGGKIFQGDQPCHMLVAATTGGGKSTLMASLAMQVAGQLKLLVVINDGPTVWPGTCKAIDPDCVPIVVRSNSNQTFNIFQTGGALTAQHMASCTALVHMLCGVHADQDKDKLRHAIIAETVGEIYGIAYRKWRNSNPGKHWELVNQEYNLGSEEEIEQYVSQECFKTFTPGMFPTLTDLQDELHAASLQKGPHQEHCAAIASLLRPWLRDGIYGPIVDGVGTIDLGRSAEHPQDKLQVIHFELGALGQSESELKSVIGFLITNEVRNLIQGMPLGHKKMVIMEEMNAFLKVPGAQWIVVDYYQQMRKYGCQVTSIFQSYSTLLEASPIVAKAIISNASAMLLLRNHNRADLKLLGSFLPAPIPDVVIDKITRFPKPAEQEPQERYAGFMYCQLDGEAPRYTAGRNYISHEVERITKINQ